MSDHSEQIADLAVALAKAQGAYAPVKKSGIVPGFSQRRERRYATLDDILEGTRKALSENGLSVLQVMGDEDHLETILLHASGQWFSSTLRLALNANKDVNAAQQFGSALTYARRYAMSALLGVVAEEDDDAEGSGTASVKGRARQAAAPETAEGVCPVHHQAFVERKGTSKATGKPYHFWACPVYDCKERPLEKPVDPEPNRAQAEAVEDPAPFEEPQGAREHESVGGQWGPWTDAPMPAAAAVGSKPAPPATEAEWRAQPAAKEQQRALLDAGIKAGLSRADIGTRVNALKGPDGVLRAGPASDLMRQWSADADAKDADD